MTQAPAKSNTQAETEHSVGDAVRSNSDLLHRLLEQVSDLKELLASQPSSGNLSRESQGSSNGSPDEVAGVSGFKAEREHENQIAKLESQLSDLRQQNRELAAKVADRKVAPAICDDGANQSLSWEQRKELMLQQMEEDSFDAEAFVAAMPAQSEDAKETPESFLKKLLEELDARDQQLQELRDLLDQQSQTHGAQEDAIAEIIDRDERVCQERQRLQLLQTQWKEKLRSGEIEASLERAKLSRERQDLEKRQAALNEQLEHLHRELQHPQDGTTPSPTSSRRWLVKLGLCDHQ